MSPDEKAQMLVLYASQTGNSEQAAIEFSTKWNSTVTGEYLQSRSKGNDEEVVPVVTATAMQMDDFLELKRAAWTPIVVIFVSSYGVGQAPLGGYRFRELCDYWLAQSSSTSTSTDTAVLKGLSFALCGLGDSSYSTFFQNPTALKEALCKMGATLIGTVAKADANISLPADQDDQATVIQKWTDAIVEPILQTMIRNKNQQVPTQQQMQQMQQTTLQICKQINPEFPDDDDDDNNNSNNDGSPANANLSTYVMPVIFILLGIILQQIIKKILET